MYAETVPADPKTPKYHSFMDFDGQILGGFVVPQAAVELGVLPTTTVPIRFAAQEFIPGLPLQSALQGRVGTHTYGLPKDVVDPSNRMFKVVIHWPGYEQWAMQLQLPEVVTVNMVAQVAAAFTKKFLEQMRTVPSTEESSDWWVTRVDFKDLIMVELRNIAPGTWQPFLLVYKVPVRIL